MNTPNSLNPVCICQNLSKLDSVTEKHILFCPSLSMEWMLIKWFQITVATNCIRRTAGDKHSTKLC